MKIKYYESGYVWCPKLGKCVYPDICTTVCKHYVSGKAFDHSIDCSYDRCSECPSRRKDNDGPE